MMTEKFSTLFKYAPKSQLKASDGGDEGNFSFYTSSSIVSKRTNKAQYFDESLIFGNGGAANIHYASEPFGTTSHCFVAVPKTTEINPKYVYYYLLGNIHLLERGFKGAGLKNISSKYIENLDIPIFSIETQNKIVSVLDKASALISRREQTLQLLDELLRAKFLEMFGDPISNNRKWQTENLGSIAKLERGRFSPRPRNDPSYFGGEYPFVQTGDVNSSKYRLGNYTQTLNEKGIKVSKKFNVGDILIAIVGATIGATTILEIDTYAPDSIIGIKSIEKTNNVFLEMLLRFYRQFLLDTAPEAARANINLSILDRLSIIIPPIELQEKYVDIDKKIEVGKSKLYDSIHQIEELYQSLVQKAFNGELNFNIDFELDALIREIDLQKKENNLSKIGGDIAYLQRLVDKLNAQEFKEKDLYDKAKHAAFQLMAVKEEEKKLTQEYNEKTESIELTLK